MHAVTAAAAAAVAMQKTLFRDARKPKGVCCFRPYVTTARPNCSILNPQTDSVAIISELHKRAHASRALHALGGEKKASNHHQDFVQG